MYKVITTTKDGTVVYSGTMSYNAFSDFHKGIIDNIPADEISATIIGKTGTATYIARIK
jgi:hypothetical protein